MSGSNRTGNNTIAIARKGRSTWMKVMGVLAAIVVFCTTYALILPAITEEAPVYCGYESEHTDACYSSGADGQTLVCTLSEEGHAHTDACYSQNQVLTCTQPEGGHAHTDACYSQNPVLVCAEAHEHSDACFELQNVLICTEQETEPHVHTDACYATDRVLTCSQEEKAAHTHTEECYEKGKTLTCTKPVHEHTLQCFSNPAADVETADVWERTVNDVVLTRVWADDVVKIAESQIGYKESTQNYQVQEDGETVKGYSRYGAWYGDPYGDWCAMFVSFCLNYSHIDAKYFPRESNCQEWINKLKELNMYHSTNAEEELQILEKIAADKAAKEAEEFAAAQAAAEAQALAEAEAQQGALETIEEAAVDVIPAAAPAETAEEVIETVEVEAADTTVDAAPADAAAAQPEEEKAFEPKAGDLIFFDFDHETDTEHRSDHVGLIKEIKRDEKTDEITEIKTIEGNSNDAVTERTWKYDDPRIKGYGVLPENPDPDGVEEVVEEAVEEIVEEVETVEAGDVTLLAAGYPGRSVSANISNDNSVVIVVGDTLTLGTDHNSNSWTSTPTNVVNITGANDRATITAKETTTVKTTTITHTYKQYGQNKTETISVTVIPNTISATVDVGETVTLSQTTGTASSTWGWTSLDTGIATVQSNTRPSATIKGEADGYAVIRFNYSSSNPQYQYFLVEVVGIPTYPVTVDAGSDVVITPAAGTDHNYTGLNTNVATFDAATNKVHGVGGGTTTMTHTYKDSSGTERTEIFNITVNGARYVTVVQGRSVSLEYTGGTNTSNHSWTSADSSIATVDSNGRITGVKSGSQTTITHSYSQNNTTKTETYLVNVVPAGETTEEYEPYYRKYIDYKGGESYDLTLDVKADTTVVRTQKLDIVVVLDRSSSMDTTDTGITGGSRMTRAKNALAGSTGLADLLYNGGVDARYSLVTFGGQTLQQYPVASATYTWMDRDTFKTTVNGISAVSDQSGTNYEGALHLAAQQITRTSSTTSDDRTGALKIVVFLTDGVPTRWGYDSTSGTGSEYDSGGVSGGQNVGDSFTHGKDGAAEIKNADIFYGIGFGADMYIREGYTHKYFTFTTSDGTTRTMEPQDILYEIGDAIPVKEVRTCVVESPGSELLKLFEKFVNSVTQVTAINATVTDTLSAYAEPNGANAMLKIVVTDKDGNTVCTSTGTIANPVTATIEANQSAIINPTTGARLNPNGVKVQAIYENDTKTVKLQFLKNDDSGAVDTTYRLEDKWTYSVTLNVKPTELAYQTKASTGYNAIGQGSSTDTTAKDYGATDVPGRDKDLWTSTGKDGFFTNASANLIYTGIFNTYSKEYKKPVLQVTDPLEDIRLTKVDGDTKDDETGEYGLKLPGVKFDLYELTPVEDGG